MNHCAIKICGITTSAMARSAALIGVDYIGIIFYPFSSRAIALDTAVAIAQATKEAGAHPVAVFVDEDIAMMKEICAATKIEIVQLHGDISRRDHALLPQHIQRIYACSVTTDSLLSDDADLQSLDLARDFILIDHAQPGQGHKIASSFQYQLPFRWFLAGGLNAANVSDAIAKFKPHGVDVSSGVEVHKGQKDLSLIQQFVQSVRAQHHAA
jgi:phosphoribosylanthranilate isomerase